MGGCLWVRVHVLKVAKGGPARVDDDDEGCSFPQAGMKEKRGRGAYGGM